MGESRHPHPQQTAEKVLARTQRDHEIIKLKRSGKSTREVSEAIGCGINTVTEVHKRAIAEVRDGLFTDSALFVAESLDRLGTLLAAIWDGAVSGNVKCVTEARLLIAEMATYTGAKAPIRYEWGESDVDRAIRELGEVLNARADQAAGQASHPADVAG